MNKAIWEHLDYVNGTLWVVQTHYVYPRVNIHNELSLIWILQNSISFSEKIQYDFRTF